MPVVTIEQSAGRSSDQKLRVSELVTAAFVEVYGLSSEQVTILFHELSLENMAKEGILYSDRE